MPIPLALPNPQRSLFDARPHRHIVLVGPSGAGKSTVAPRLAQSLGFAAQDLDGLIEQRTKASITEIFAALGERGFRALEVATVRRLLRRRRPTVIAAGGGAWHNPEARTLLLAGAQEVLLRIEPGQALQRLQQGGGMAARPMLVGGNPLEALRELAQQRATNFALCRVAVDGAEGTPDEVARRIVAALYDHVPQALEAEHLGHRYPIILSAEGPLALVNLLQHHPRAKRVMVVADATVAQKFAPQYLAALRQLGLHITVHEVAPGEGSKSFSGAEGLIGALSAAGLSRADIVVGLGGGMVLDLAAFAAGIYLRGVAFVGVATTALAAVDASVGGKCGINFGATKNQVGLIRAPHAVVVDTAAVMAQPAQERAQGAVEALKMGALFAPELFWAVQSMGQDPEQWRRTMAMAVALKIAVCRKDPHERGLRATLNYGHTLGHAFESGAHLAMNHGEAVALGMVAEAAFAESLGLASGVVAPLCQALRAMNMPVDWRRANLHSDALKRDKKGDGHAVVLPVVTSLGHVTLHSVAVAQLIEFVRRT